VSVVATAAVIGEELAVEGYALAGCVLLPADNPDEVNSAWLSLPADTVLLILTESAATWLADRLAQRPDIMTAVMPP
jgi:vacuolar-type H+-ATPase subunit F/Vma7